MITEDYVPFEIAKLLKEKGFGFNSCSAYYTLHGEVCEIGKSQEIGIAPRPTLQMAMKWLREVHNIDISVTPDRKAGYSVLIFKDKRLPFYTLDSYSIYEEACEAAIKYCLENLI